MFWEDSGRGSGTSAPVPAGSRSSGRGGRGCAKGTEPGALTIPGTQGSPHSEVPPQLPGISAPQQSAPVWYRRQIGELNQPATLAPDRQPQQEDAGPQHPQDKRQRAETAMSRMGRNIRLPREIQDIAQGFPAEFGVPPIHRSIPPADFNGYPDWNGFF